MSVHALVAILLCILTILGEILLWFFFLFGFAGDLFFKAESVSFSFSRSKKQALNTDSLSSLSLGRVHPVTASVLKL